MLQFGTLPLKTQLLAGGTYPAGMRAALPKPSQAWPLLPQELSRFRTLLAVRCPFGALGRSRGTVRALQL